MKRFSLIVAMLCLFGVAMAQQTVKQKVAVYVTGDAENGYKKVIGSKLVTGITKSNNYIAVERTADFLAELAKEQDYQVSGAVSDKQIARLGQQFGVGYVLVADVSEVFESIFISARMINVQTAQITNSTEGSATVDNMESLVGLSENIVRNLFYVAKFSEDAIKITGPYSTAKKLYEVIWKKLIGYHVATQEEIEQISKEYRILNKKLKFPIYTGIEVGYKSLEQKIRWKNNGQLATRNISAYDISCGIIYEDGSSRQLTLSFVNDDTWSNWVNECSGVYNMTNNPQITSGYVYWIKN